MSVLIAWLAGYTFGTILFLSAIITFSIKIFLFPRLVRKLPEFIPTKKVHCFPLFKYHILISYVRTL